MYVLKYTVKLDYTQCARLSEYNIRLFRDIAKNIPVIRVFQLVYAFSLFVYLSRRKRFVPDKLLFARK